MKLADLVHQPLAVMSPLASCAKAALLMRERRVGSVVIAEQARPLGIITDRDLVTRVMAQGYQPEQLAVREVMTAFPATLRAANSVEDAVRTMRELAIRRIPVVDDAGTLVGMVALDDLIIQLSRQLHELGLAIEGELGPLPEEHVS